MVVITKCQELFAGELCPVVGDDGAGDPKSVDNVSEEQHRLLGFDSVERTSLDPFGELVD
jgi:hypothetical protein